MSATVTAPVRVVPRRVLYVGLSGVMALIAFVGFWPKYFGPLVLGTLVQPLLIHIHATVFTGWLVLFFLQAYFAATKRIQLHLRVGKAGIWYGVVLILVGLTTGVIRSSSSPPGRAEALLLAIIEDMVMFAAFFGVAIWHRKKPKIHRPAMVVAATTLLVAAVARMTFVPPGPSRLAIWSIPILIAAAAEFKQTRSVHPVYLIGVGVCVVRIFNGRSLHRLLRGEVSRSGCSGWWRRARRKRRELTRKVTTANTTATIYSTLHADSRHLRGAHD